MPEILIYSDIGESFFAEDSITGATIKPQLQGDISVRINSPGGDAFEGLAIYNLLAQHDGRVDVYIDGLAASAASVIAMAGDNVYMPATSMIMIHDPMQIVAGNSEDMAEAIARLNKVKESIVPAYTAKTGLDAQQISDMMTAETWLTGAEASELGFATLVDGDPATFSNSAKPWIKNAPESLQIAAKAEDPEPETEPEQAAEPWRIKLAKRRLDLIE